MCSLDGRNETNMGAFPGERKVRLEGSIRSMLVVRRAESRIDQATLFPPAAGKVHPCATRGTSENGATGEEAPILKLRTQNAALRTSPLNLSLHSEGGFTLIEVLLAVSLVALMATLVFGSLYVTTTAIDVARANSANEQIVRSTLRVMIDELSVGKDSSTGRWMGINGLYDGQPADSVAFLTVGQFRGAESNKDTELVRIVYTREGDLLLRFVRKNLYGLTDESIERVELARKVKGFNVRYFDGKANLWVDEWNGSVRGIPKALLLELTLLQENEELQTIRQWVTVGAS